jgi:hypothetical protein
MDKYIYKIEPEYTYNKPTIYRVRIKRLNNFFGYKFYTIPSDNKNEYPYVSINNGTCLFDCKDIFKTEDKDEAEKFINWCKDIDKSKREVYK